MDKFIRIHHCQREIFISDKFIMDDKFIILVVACDQETKAREANRTFQKPSKRDLAFEEVFIIFQEFSNVKQLNIKMEIFDRYGVMDMEILNISYGNL